MFSFRPTSRRKPEYEPSLNTDEAQKKFGNVKAISSDMYFGRQDHADVSKKQWQIFLNAKIFFDYKHGALV